MIRSDPILADHAYTRLERIPTTVCDTEAEASRRVAGIIAETIRAKNAAGAPAVLGLATGHTPIGVYRELIRLHRDEVLDFSNVVTFNLDEYHPMPSDSIQSYRRWMRENFFDHINIPDANVHTPDGTLPKEQVAGYCEQYEQDIAAVGGIDVQILGIGRTGHIGFNEPGSSRQSRTRLIGLDPVTRRDASADFFGETNVPRHAITMGVGSILDAKRVLLMAFGEHKAPIVREAVEGEISTRVAASFLQEHPNAEVIVDIAAGANLTRIETPWLLGDIDWTETMIRRAVIWLSLTTGKSILKLDTDDYDTHHLASLVRLHDSADALGRAVHRHLWATITRQAELPDDKTVLCFSPHPDDDVISMGATLRNLVERGNKVHVAYMTSGNIAVADDHALQMVDFWAELNEAMGIDAKKSEALRDEIHDFVENKPVAAIDSKALQEVKRVIRHAEAVAACRMMMVPEDNAHMLDLPFYQTGQVRKRPIGSDDVRIVLDLITKLRPDWVFVAGELSDPHGTHRLCAEAIFAGLSQCSPAVRPELVWLYRGAWQEWEPDVIDMAVPMSRSELTHKVFGIFKHQSQKDKALFPGPYDDREFWQRAEARNTETAEIYDKLGLPEYHAMEAFVLHELK